MIYIYIYIILNVFISTGVKLYYVLNWSYIFWCKYLPLGFNILYRMIMLLYPCLVLVVIGWNYYCLELVCLLYCRLFALRKMWASVSRGCGAETPSRRQWALYLRVKFSWYFLLFSLFEENHSRNRQHHIIHTSEWVSRNLNKYINIHLLGGI